MKTRDSLSLLFVGSIVVLLAAYRTSRSSTPAGEAADWTMYGGTNNEQRFSPLDKISEQNVGQNSACFGVENWARTAVWKLRHWSRTV